jgi:hypothetical protein
MSSNPLSVTDPLATELRLDPNAPPSSLEDVLAELFLRRAREAVAQSLSQEKENPHGENSRQADAANAAEKNRET